MSLSSCSFGPQCRISWYPILLAFKHSTCYMIFQSLAVCNDLVNNIIELKFFVYVSIYVFVCFSWVLKLSFLLHPMLTFLPYITHWIFCIIHLTLFSQIYVVVRTGIIFPFYFSNLRHLLGSVDPRYSFQDTLRRKTKCVPGKIWRPSGVSSTIKLAAENM